MWLLLVDSLNNVVYVNIFYFQKVEAQHALISNNMSYQGALGKYSSCFILYIISCLRKYIVHFDGYIKFIMF